MMKNSQKMKESCLKCKNFSKLILLPMTCKHPICTTCFCSVHLADLESLPPKSTRIYCCDICSCETIYTRKLNFKIEQMIAIADKDAIIADEFVIKRNRNSFIEDLEQKMSSPATVKKGEDVEEEETEETEKISHNHEISNLNISQKSSSRSNTKRILWDSSVKDLVQQQQQQQQQKEIAVQISKTEEIKNPQKNIFIEKLEGFKNLERCGAVKFEPLKHYRVQKNPRKHKLSYLNEQKDKNSKTENIQKIQQGISDITFFTFMKQDNIKHHQAFISKSKTLEFKLFDDVKTPFKKSQKKSKTKILEEKEEEFHNPENLYKDQDKFMTIQFRASYKDQSKKSSSPLKERISASKSILKNSPKKTVNFSASKTKQGFAAKKLYRTFHATDADRGNNLREKLDFDLSQSFTESNKQPLQKLRKSQIKNSSLSELKRQLNKTENRGTGGHFRSKTNCDIKLTPRELKKSILMDKKYSSKIPVLPIPPSQKMSLNLKGTNKMQLRNITVAAESVESYNAGQGYFLSKTSDRERRKKSQIYDKISCDFLNESQNGNHMKISGAFQRSLSRMSAMGDNSDGDSGCGLRRLHRSLYKPADHFNSSQLLLKKVMVYKGLERNFNN